MAYLINSSFKPAWWLNSPHLQTIWPSLFRTRVDLNFRQERIELSDGDFIDLSWHGSKGPLVMVIHGLEGSLSSHYVTPLLKALKLAGFSTLFMHLRGCSEEPNRLARSYHSGATEDLKEILEKLQLRNQQPKAVIGFSLGGNLLLKYLAESGNQSGIQAAIAISVPFNLAHAARRLETGLSRIYGRYLLGKLLRSYQRKCRINNISDSVDTSKIHTIYDFDNKITSQLNGFRDADDYYHRCSSGFHLKKVVTPTLIIHAEDDPFTLSEDSPKADELGPGITLELTPQGGHVGFIQGNIPWHPEYWLDRRIIQYLKQQNIEAREEASEHSDLQLSSN